MHEKRDFDSDLTRWIDEVEQWLDDVETDLLYEKPLRQRPGLRATAHLRFAAKETRIAGWPQAAPFQSVQLQIVSSSIPFVLARDHSLSQPLLADPLGSEGRSVRADRQG
jgi:hypothetical protein